MEQRHTVNFCCVIQCEWYSGVLCRRERMRLFPCSWSDFYARVFFPNMVCEWNPACIRIHQHASGCRLQTQHTSAFRHIPLLLLWGCRRSLWSASGWSLTCSERRPSLNSQGSRVPATMCCGVWAESAGAGKVSRMEGSVVPSSQDWKRPTLQLVMEQDGEGVGIRGCWFCNYIYVKGPE